MKLCDCRGHKNKDYLESHTSLRKFTNAILCPAIEYESISGDYESLNSIQEQEMVNITASNEKVKNKKIEVCNTKENRNIKSPPLQFVKAENYKENKLLTATIREERNNGGGVVDDNADNVLNAENAEVDDSELERILNANEIHPGTGEIYNFPSIKFT